jgi:hypothetical protein
LNTDELRAEVAKFGEPKTVTMMLFRLTHMRFLAAHEQDDLVQIVSGKDLELALAYGRTVEEIMNLPLPVRRSLEEKYDAENLSLKERLKAGSK